MHIIILIWQYVKKKISKFSNFLSREVLEGNHKKNDLKKYSIQKLL